MQEQNAPESPKLVARIGLWNIIWMTLFGALMLAAAIIWLAPHSSLPTASGRAANDSLPWKSDKLRVDALDAHWESAEGNERMMLRLAYYPVAEVTLGESQGKGMLYIHFEDERGHRAGDAITLTYDNGNFTPREEMNIKTEGNKARVFVEAGYIQQSAFELHCCDGSSPLWRVYLRYLPEGDSAIQDLGYVTIPAMLRS